MKKRIFLVLTFLLVNSSSSSIAGTEIILLNSLKTVKTKISLVSSSPDEIILTFSVNTYLLSKVTTPMGQSNIISLPDGSPILQKGAPDLGKLTQPVIIPDTEEMQISVVSSQFTDIKNISIAPSKGTLYRNVNPASVPYTYGREYMQDAFFPAETAALREPYIVRDFRGQTVVVYPLQYNPATKTLRIYTTITVKVSPTGKPGKINVFTHARSKKTISDAFGKMYTRRFINYETFRYTPLSDRGSMLIICHEDFLDEMEPFVAWKKLKGMPTEIVNVSDIGTNSSAIKSYISDYYDTHDDLTFLLLVGDYAQIPTSSTSNGDSDPAYGYIKGDDAYPEIIIGRFSGETSAHISTQVERSVEYEKNPEAGADWYHKAVGIASNEGSNPVDWKWMRDVRTSLLGYTYTDVDEFYDGSQGGEDADGNPNASMVKDALNEGRGLFNYMGHGNTTVLATSGFNNTAVSQLTNDNKLPFAWLGACLTGNLKNNTCFSEACMRATNGDEPTGFIGVLGASISHPWVPPMHGMKEMNDILIESYQDNIKRTYGGLCINGIMHMLDTQGSSGIRAADTWLLFGDPSLVVRTDTPEEMVISHPPVILLNATEFSVECNTNDALISLTVEGEIIGTAYVTSSTTAVPIDPALNTTAETMQITVTAYNKIPYMKDVPIEITAITVNTINDTLPAGGFLASPNPADRNSHNIYFTFTAAGSGSAQLKIYDAVGNCIHENSQDFTSRGNSMIKHTFTPWDCKNKVGRVVATGTYHAVLRLTYSDGTIAVLTTSIGISDK